MNFDIIHIINFNNIYFLKYNYIVFVFFLKLCYNKNVLKRFIMKRKFINELLNWKKNKRTKPLMIYGQDK